MAKHLLYKTGNNIILHLCWLMLVSCSAPAQSYKVYMASAYSRQFIPGNIVAEEERPGKSPQHTFIYFVYLETSSKEAPKISAAWIKGVSYQATIFEIPGKSTVAGITQASDSVVLKAAKNNYLYKIEFQPADSATQIPASYRTKTTGKILMQLLINGKPQYITTQTIRMLQPEIVY